MNNSPELTAEIDRLMRLTYGHVSEGIIRMIAEDNLKEKGNNMTTDEPNPNDLCECGHFSHEHLSGHGRCVEGAFSLRDETCQCPKFTLKPVTNKPATPQPNPHIIIGRFNKCLCGVFEGKSLTCSDIIQSINEIKTYGQSWDGGLLARLFESLIVDMNHQPSQVTVSGADAPRIYTRCPSCQNTTLVINKGHLLCTWIDCKDPTLIHRSNEISTLRAELSTLRQDKEKLKEALKKYGEHSRQCESGYEDDPCSCGLKEALEI